MPRPFKLRLVDHHCDRHRARSLLQAQVKFLINLEGVVGRVRSVGRGVITSQVGM